MIKNSITKKSSDGEGALLLFDGVCNLCNGFVNFLIDRDPDGHFLFGSLQSDAAEPYLDATEVDPDEMDSMVLIDNGKVYLRSTAFLQAMKRLPLPWSLLFAFVVIPKPIRDFFYRRVATNRYDWFGKRNQCRSPTPELRKRFLSTRSMQ
jgi:predicted DCC family thiol-disulfide oxidoreductase YuxK